MNNQVKLIELLTEKMLAHRATKERCWKLGDKTNAHHQEGRELGLQTAIDILTEFDTPPVPAIGCSKCDYKGYFEYETGVVDEGTGIKEIAKEPCDCVIDPAPTIKPGDKVDYHGFQFPFLKGVIVDHLKIMSHGTYVVLEYEGLTYVVSLADLEVVE